MNEKINVRVPMMQNKGNYLAAADHELQCDILQVGDRHLVQGSEICIYKKEDSVQCNIGLQYRAGTITV